MKFSLACGLLFVLCFFGASVASAQVDSLVAQITSSTANTFVRDISGDGRFVVFESSGDIATERTDARNNADGNTEIFLFDYAQRRIFQITNTKRVLNDVTASATTSSNIVVDINSTRPAIANQLVNNELWIAFSSNATSSVAGTAPNGTNPGNFDGTALNATNRAAERAQVVADGNTEIWLYRVLITSPAVNLSSGIEPPFNDLSAGTFQQVTNTAANTPSQAGSSTLPAFVSDDNRDVTINDTASTLAFISNRDLLGNNNNSDFNGEVFAYNRNANAFQQITQTPRSNANGSIFNQNPSISGDGTKLAFFSNATTPRSGVTVTNGDNTDNNGEVFYATLNATGAPTAFAQVTRTARVNPNDTVVIFSAGGRRISRDGRYVGFETLSNNPASGGTNQTGYQVYVYDATAATYTAVGPRSDADTAAPFGDVRRFPTFSNLAAGDLITPVVVFASRLNFTAAGAVPTTASDGLNPDASRQVQFYSYPLALTPATITRISRFSTSALSEVPPIASNTTRRIAFNIAQEIGTGNVDFSSEAFYLLTPPATTETQTTLSLLTGASALPVATPTASPTPTPSPSPSPTPQIAAGLSRNMIGVVRLTGSTLSVSQTATSATNTRRFPLPIELGGVSLSINNLATGIYSVDATRNEVRFVTPAGLAAGTYSIVLNDNGRISRGTLLFVAAQPDILRRDNVVASAGRASVFNATTGVALQGEPFPVNSIRLRGGYNILPTRLRVFLTGVQDVAASAITIQIGSVTVPAANILTSATPTNRPGVFSIDFRLPPETRTLGDVPIVISVTSGGTTFTSRLSDTAPRIRILP